MVGVTKKHTERKYGRAFPRSRYNDPRGGRLSSLERNVLRYRAVEAMLYLFYAEEVRSFMLTNIYPQAVKDSNTAAWNTFEERRLQSIFSNIISDAESKGSISVSDAQALRDGQGFDQKRGKKLRKAFGYAVDSKMFTTLEADELMELLTYRNDIAHRIHLVMLDMSRSYWASDHIAFSAPTYKGDALDRLRTYRESLWERARSLLLTLSFDHLLFEHAERTYEEELKRLERLIEVQIRRERERANSINAELDLRQTELVRDLDPRFPANFCRNGEDGGPSSGHLTKRGVEICYRLFDMGKSPLAVAYLMGISLRAAQHRKKSWDSSGGAKRVKSEVKRYNI